MTEWHMALVHVQMLNSSWSILNECDECKLTSEKNIVFSEKIDVKFLRKFFIQFRVHCLLNLLTALCQQFSQFRYLHLDYTLPCVIILH